MSTDELERLIKAGTPGPLEIETAPDREPWIKGATGEWLAMCCGHTDEKAEANAALICAAVNALPELVALRRENERLRAELEAARVHAWLNDEPQEKASPDEPN